jgi:quinol monooxygenase YgiN
MTTQDTGGPIRKTVLITAKAGGEAQLREALLDLQTATRQEPGCRFFTFYGALDDAGLFVLAEDFTDAQAFAAGLTAETKAFA